MEYLPLIAGILGLIVGLYIVLMYFTVKRDRGIKARSEEVEERNFYTQDWSEYLVAHYRKEYREELDHRYIYRKRNFMSSAYRLSDEEIKKRIAFLEKGRGNPSDARGINIGTQQTVVGESPAILPDDVRDRDLYIIGKKRSGKSTLLFNLARQDIEQGRGVAVIDPHGDLIERLLDHIPRERTQDVIYFDASNKDHPLPLNILCAQDESETALLADDLMVTFKRLSDSWGERMENILRYTFHTLLMVKGTTFLDIQNILQNQPYREHILSQINSQPLLDFWQYQFPQLPKDATQPILSRMSKFVLSPILYGILSHSVSHLNFYIMMQEKKIFLADISQGKIGQETSNLLGSLLVSQIQLATMRRAKLSEAERQMYFLYIDEFQNFTSSAFDKILSEAGKYKLSLTLAHQYISQLDDKIRKAILGNVGSIIVLPSNPEDARALKEELGSFTPEDVVNLNPFAHEALYRPATGAKDTLKINTLAPPPRPATNYRVSIIEYTRDNYSSAATVAARQTSAPRESSSNIESSIQPTVPRQVQRPKREDISPMLEKEFATNKEKTLYFIGIAGYLSAQQIIRLCYSHVAKSAQATTASRDLRDLVRDKKIKEQFFGKEKIYYTSAACDPTKHNLGIRDLFLKIVSSKYEIAESDFSRDLKGLKPDLSVSFLSKNGALIKSFWEFDTGTEGIGEIIKKVRRYEPYSRDHLITVVVTQQKRLSQLCAAIKEPFIIFAAMDKFQILDDCSFQSSENENSFPFFV